MKTPDEIKKGLKHCSSKSPCCSCPMWDECKEAGSLKKLFDNALALIQQLEAQNAEQGITSRMKGERIRILEKRCKQLESDKQQLEGMLTHMNQLRDAAAGRALKMEERVHQLEAERDAMKALFVDSNELCVICKHQTYDDSVCSKVDYCCELCSPNCACHGCVEASHYEWHGVQKEE